MPAQSIQSEGRAWIISNDGSSGNACNLPQLKVAAFPFFPFRFFFLFFAPSKLPCFVCSELFFSLVFIITPCCTPICRRIAPLLVGCQVPPPSRTSKTRRLIEVIPTSTSHIPLPYPQPSPLPFNTPLPPAAVLHSRNAEVPLIQFD